MEAESSSKGFLPPRLTTIERDAISNPAAGLLIYNTDTDCTNFYNGTKWKSICGDCPIPVTPVPGTHVPDLFEITWHWNAVPEADGYKYNTSNDYLTATDVGNVLTYTQTGLDFNTPYSLYVWAYSDCGFSAVPGVLTATTDCPVIASPTAETHIPTSYQIAWHWNAVQYADGYKWNAANDYATATDVGNVLTYTQTGLSPLTPYTLYVWAYVTGCGASANPVSLSSTTTSPLCVIGNTGPGGGKIFYCGSPYNLEATASDNSSGAKWGCNGTDLNGAGGTAIGTGAQNTTDIVNGCGDGGIAAKICDGLTSGGKSDWFLPSRDELNAMYNQENAIGGFANAWYWSSSEDGSTTAWIGDFDNGIQGSSGKLSNYRVRCARAF